MTEGDESVIGYLKYCREQGMNYKAEITDMLQGGLYTYKDKVQAIMQVRFFFFKLLKLSCYVLTSTIHFCTPRTDPCTTHDQAEADKVAGVLTKGAKKDSEVYAAYRLNVTNAGIASEYDKKRRTLVVRDVMLCLVLCALFCSVCAGGSTDGRID